MNASRIRAALEDAKQRADARAAEEKRALAPPGAMLDKHPWAHSWGSYLQAVSDENDIQGARAAIRKAQDIRNAAMSERVPSEGGFLVPWSLQKQVLGLMTSAIVRPRAMYVPVTGLRTAVPFLENYSQEPAGQALGGLQFGP